MGANQSQIDQDKIVSHGKPTNYWFFIHDIYKKSTIPSAEAFMYEIKALLPVHLKGKLRGFVLEGENVKVYTDDWETATLACARVNNRIISGNIVTTSGPERNDASIGGRRVELDSPDSRVVKAQQEIMDKIKWDSEIQKELVRGVTTMVPITPRVIPTSSTTKELKQVGMVHLNKKTPAEFDSTSNTATPGNRAPVNMVMNDGNVRGVATVVPITPRVNPTSSTTKELKQVGMVHLNKKREPIEHKYVIESSETEVCSVNETTVSASVHHYFPKINRTMPSANMDDTMHSVGEEVHQVQPTGSTSEDQGGRLVLGGEEMDVRRPPPFHQSKSMSDVQFDRPENVKPRLSLGATSFSSYTEPNISCSAEPTMDHSSTHTSSQSSEIWAEELSAEEDLVIPKTSDEEDFLVPQTEPLMSKATEQRINTWLSNQNKQDNTVLQNRVWIMSLPPTVNGSQLRHVFASQCEGVRGAYIHKTRKGCGVVILCTVEQAKDCATKMDKSGVFGQPIRVHTMRVKNEKKKPARQRHERRRVPRTRVAQESCDRRSVASDLASNMSEKSGQAASESSRKTQFPVIVNGLPNEVTSNQLRKLFAGCKGVKVAFIYKSSHGSGEVVFNTAEEMHACVEKMNNTIQFGRKIRVRVKHRKEKAGAQEHSDGKGSEENSKSANTSVTGSVAQGSDTSDDNDSVLTSSSIKSDHTQSKNPNRVNKMAVVNGLPYQLTTEEFEKDVSSLCRGVKRAYIHRSRKGCGEIIFQSPELMYDGVKRLQGTVLRGRHVCVRPREQTREKEAIVRGKVVNEAPPVTPMVIVSGLPKTISSGQFSECFKARFAEMEIIEHDAENGTAEIAFKTTEQAQKCVEAMDQKKCFGATLSVCVKESRKVVDMQRTGQDVRRERRRGRGRGRGRKHGSTKSNADEKPSNIGDENGSSSDSSLSLTEEPYLGTSSKVGKTAAPTQTDEAPKKSKAKPPKQAGKKGSRSAKSSDPQPTEGCKVVVKNVPPTTITDFSAFLSTVCKGVEILSIGKQSKGLLVLALANNELCKNVCETIDGKTYNGQKIIAELKR